MAGVDSDDPLTQYGAGKKPEHYTDFLQKDGLQGARIGVLRILSDQDPDPEMARIFENALARIILGNRE
jgi:hypothetical protein